MKLPICLYPTVMNNLLKLMYFFKIIFLHRGWYESYCKARKWYVEVWYLLDLLISIHVCATLVTECIDVLFQWDFLWFTLVAWLFNNCFIQSTTQFSIINQFVSIINRLFSFFLLIMEKQSPTAEPVLVIGPQKIQQWLHEYDCLCENIQYRWVTRHQHLQQLVGSCGEVSVENKQVSEGATFLL